MIEEYTIEVDITPVPASRPRVTRWSTYYGKKHTQYVKDVSTLGFKCTPEKPQDPLETIIMVNTTYALPLPKSMPKKRRIELDGSFCDKNIDLDNLNKLFWDSVLVDGGIIKDDSQIVISESKKIWTCDDNGYTMCVIRIL